MDLDIADDVELRGEPSETLPTRPMLRDELAALVASGTFDAVRVPEDGTTILDGGGLAVGDENPETVSEFLLVGDDTSWLFRFGFPEVVAGDPSIPDGVASAQEAGWVRWWRTEVILDDGDPPGDVDLSFREWFERQTVPLEP